MTCLRRKCDNILFIDNCCIIVAINLKGFTIFTLNILKRKKRKKEILDWNLLLVYCMVFKEQQSIVES